MFSLGSFNFALPEIALTLFITLILMYTIARPNALKSVVITQIYVLTIIAISITLIILVTTDYGHALNEVAFHVFITNPGDRVLIVVKSIILLSTFFTLIITRNYIYKNFNTSEYFILILCAVLGMLVIVSANDLILLYLGIELQSLSAYLLAAYKRNNEASTEAGIKYFVLGAFTTGILLFGCLLLYAYSGITNLTDLALFISTYNDITAAEIPLDLIVGLTALVVALLFKIAAAPFHMWAPDVYEGSPLSVTAFFAIVTKFPLVFALIKITLLYTAVVFPYIQVVYIICALISLFIGILAALYQVTLKRFLAYSAISHTGFILIGLAAGDVYSTLVYVIFYICMSIALFAALFAVPSKTITAHGHTKVLSLKRIDQFFALGQYHKVIAIYFAIILFSIAGIPPLAGFYSKLFILQSAINSELYFVALSAVILSAVSAFYYIRFIRLMFFSIVNDNFSNKADFCVHADLQTTPLMVSTIFVLFIVLFFIYPTYILNFIPSTISL